MKQINLRYQVAIITTYLLLSITKTNAQWSELGGKDSSTFNNIITSLTTDHGGNVYAGGYFINESGKWYVAKWNGRSWGEVGGKNSSTFSDYIRCLATDAVGNLYVANSFGIKSPGGFSLYVYVSKWNGNKWQMVGDSTTNFKTFDNIISSLTTDANGNLYAACGIGGYYFYPYIAKWDGSNWQQLGDEHFFSFTSEITSLATDAIGNVYAAGNFTDSNGKEYVAKWDGSSWQEVGGADNSMFNGPIRSIAIDSIGNLYAAGYFRNDSGKEYVAKWNGSSWEELGGTNSSKFNSSIERIIIDAMGNVYAAGGFNDDSGKHYIAEWDGKVWSELGGNNTSKFNSYISSIIIDSNNVYCGGGFTNDSGYEYVAKYTQQALPLTLASINATPKNNNIAINWQTATELNTSHFIIQHSNTGTSFTNIGNVKAIGSGANGYQFVDTHPANGTNYYRLQSVDKDGSATYSKIVSCQLSVVSNQLTVFPNPSKDKVTINGSHIASVQVIDNMGRVVKIVALHDATNPSVSVGSLPKGMYHFRIEMMDGSVSSKAIMVNH